MNDFAVTTQPHIEISLDNLIHNLKEIRKIIPPNTGVLAVVKDLAYGCGAVAVAKTLEEQGVDFFAVATVNEARLLRESGIHSNILIFGECNRDEILWGCQNNIVYTINDLRSLCSIAALNTRVNLHCNIDTGMGRLGIRPVELPYLIEILKKNPMLCLQGAFTHFPKADEPNTPMVAHQLEEFNKVIMALHYAGIRPSCIHYSNSAAIMRFPNNECTYVRPGIALYGCKPDPLQQFPLDLRCIAALKGPVVKIKKVPPNTTISYGCRYITSRETYIATIAIGYAHGLPRQLSNKGSILIGGSRYTISGTVTMDYCMVDVGPATNIKVGDEAVAMGSQGQLYISADDIAIQCGTIGYEILCGLSTKIDRLYIKEGKVYSTVRGFYF